MNNLNLNLNSETIRQKTIEELKTLTRKLILNYDNWNNDNDKLVALGQHIIDEATKYLENSKDLEIFKFIYKKGIIDGFDFESYKQGIIQEIKGYSREYLEEAPSSEILMEYISLASNVGEKPVIKQKNILICLEIYKLRNKINMGYQYQPSANKPTVEDGINLELAFEQAKAVRYKSGIGQREVASYLGCSVGTISKLENGDAKNREKELIQGYISYITYKQVYVKCALDKRKGDKK